MQNRIKKDIFLTSFKNSKNDDKQIKSNATIIDNYNVKGIRENIMNYAPNLNLKNKNIINTNQTIDFKNNKNLISQKRHTNLNNDFTHKNNNLLISHQISDQSQRSNKKSDNNFVVNLWKFYLKEYLI